jgi:pyruvate/2-oxoglutarate dehydrogenase complex dihydrolipoamide acyltransferase (E2) component
LAKDVIMPALGMAQETGILLQWFKSAGDTVTRGEPLMEVETDKASVEIEATISGTLANITAKPGDVVPVGQTIAVILEAGESASASQLASAPKPVTASPVATRMAAEHNRTGPNQAAGWAGAKRRCIGVS